MIQTWDCLSLHLPKDEEKQKMMFKNMEIQKYTEIKIKKFVFIFDFENRNIYCECEKTYEFKYKVIPGKVLFAFVKEFLLRKD